MSWKVKEIAIRFHLVKRAKSRWGKQSLLKTYLHKCGKNIHSENPTSKKLKILSLRRGFYQHVEKEEEKKVVQIKGFFKIRLFFQINIRK